MNGNYVIAPSFECEGAVTGIALKAGWNTFSTPIDLHPCTDTWGEMAAMSGLSIQIAYRYDSTTEPPSWIGVAAGDIVKPLEGYYVRMATAGTAQIIANPDPTPPPTMDLSEGLNCIGLASLVDRNVVTALSSVYEVAGGDTGYVQVLNPPINVPNDWDADTYIRDNSEVPTMKVGKAYWVVMVNSGKLYGFTSTPLP
jgi:hypothetical protein